MVWRRSRFPVHSLARNVLRAQGSHDLVAFFEIRVFGLGDLRLHLFTLYVGGSIQLSSCAKSAAPGLGSSVSYCRSAPEWARPERQSFGISHAAVIARACGSAIR